ncbi:MAG: hypothetical protein ACOX5W_13670 [Bacillota bacterium]|jgi:hypothetical protein
MRKKVISKILAMSLVLSFSLVALACTDSISDKPIELENKQADLVFEANQKKVMEKYNRIKADPDFEILDDFGNGTFSFTYSKNVKNEQDKERFLKKAAEFTGQSYHPQTYYPLYKLGVVRLPVQENGYLETMINTGVTYNTNKTRVDASGNGAVQWFQEDGPYANWNRLYNIKDTITVTYGYWEGTIGTGGLNFTIGSDQAKTEISWSEKGPYYYYGKSIGSHYVTHPFLKGYKHSAIGQADVGGYQLAGGVTRGVDVRGNQY